MDLQKLADALLSSDAIEGLSKRTGASGNAVQKVLKQALPSLLNGAKAQADGEDTAPGFAAALADHAKRNTLDLTGFLRNVDLADGAKIIGHLLGNDANSTTKNVAKQAGVSKSKASSILSAAAPLLMSLLGKQADEDEEKESGVGALLGSLLGKVDVGDLLTNLLSGDDDQSSSNKKKKKKKESSDSSGIGSLLSGLLGKLLK